MTRIRILHAAEGNVLPVSNGDKSALVPIDGKFHDIHDDLIPVLQDSSVVFEVENSEASSGSAAEEGAVGLGGLTAPSDDHVHELAEKLEGIAANLA